MYYVWKNYFIVVKKYLLSFFILDSMLLILLYISLIPIQILKPFYQSSSQIIVYTILHNYYDCQGSNRVPKGRVELPCPCGHSVLNAARIPVPPPGRD